MKRKIINSIIVISLFLFLFVLISCNDYCKVNFNSNGGSGVQEQQVVKGEKVKEPENPNREGYTFDGWYYQGEKWSFVGYTVTENMTLEARWNINNYALKLSKNDERAGTISNNSGYYNYNESITITATPNQGYTFDGWYDGDNQVYTKETYTFNMPAKNLSYIAKWSANTNTAYKVEHYQQNIDNDNYPSTPFETDNLTGVTYTLTNAEANTYEGFTSPDIKQVNINGDGSTIIKLYYPRKSYVVNIDYYIDGEYKGRETESEKYGKVINSNFPFDCYGIEIYINGEFYVSNSNINYTVGLENNLEIRATSKKFKITIDNQVEGVSITGITSGNEYKYGLEIKLTATNIPEGYTIKWSRSDDLIYSGDNYTFNVPSNNITITTTIRPYVKKGNKIYFGAYPQTKVEATAENGLSSIFFDASWISYRYYIYSDITDFMYYKDVDIDNNGTYDYRGVYFSKYRPSACTYPSESKFSNQDENGYTTGKIYWFRYDPIEWNILMEESGKALIIANLALDSQEYYSSWGSSSSHNGGTGYANNYKLSNIRNFLNYSFYYKAFNNVQKSLIETTIVDNSESSIGFKSSYACDNTNDNIFLLSYREAKSIYYSNDTERQVKSTDYAKCQGLRVISGDSNLGNCPWYLRSPGSDKDDVTCVGADGSIGFSTIVHATTIGIRPACWIKL